MLIVTVENEGVQWFLRGTTWTSERARATEFSTPVQANTGLEKARKFMKQALYRKTKVVDV